MQINIESFSFVESFALPSKSDSRSQLLKIIMRNYDRYFLFVVEFNLTIILKKMNEITNF